MTTPRDASRRFLPATADNPDGFHARYMSLTITRRKRAPVLEEDAPGADNADDEEDAEEGAEDNDTPIEIAISSEAAVERYDWRTGETYLEVLDHSGKGPDLTYARDGLPFCLDHVIERQIGLVTDLRVDKDRVLRGTVHEGSHPDAEWAMADMRNGIRQKISVGYWPGEVYTQTKDKNGVITRRYSGWMPFEASTVAVPADYDVGVGRSAQGAARTSQADKATTNEVKMDQMTTSERGTAPIADTRAAELAVLARKFKKAERLADWIANGVSVESAREEILLEQHAALERQAPVAAAAEPAIRVGESREAERPFGTFGDYLRTVRKAGMGEGIDPRLARLGSGLQEGIGSDGGFLVPPQFAEGIQTRAFAGGELIKRVTKIPMAGNRYVMNIVHETSRTNGNRWGGIRGYWQAEGDTATTSKPQFRQVALDLKKLVVAAYITEEQMEDAPATAAILEMAFAEEVTFLTEQSIFEGLGAGQPMGFMNSAALVTQAAENAQTAATVNQANISKMWSRLHARSRQNAVWLIHQDVEPQLDALVIGNYPVYVPPGGLRDLPQGRLKGRDVVVTEYSATLGTVGDITLVDMSQYALGERRGMELAQSMHVRFLAGEQTFRLTYRVDGQPMWAAPLTPFKGSNTQSPFVALAAR